MTTSQTSHRPHAKELFPQQPSGQQEKPVKPPLPNLPQFQSPAVSQPTQTQLEPLPPPPVTPAKPVPMTRTQFFGLDNLPSPTADRKSTDSIGSFKFKPDVPQKPLLPKRPNVLGVGAPKTADGKSDDEGATTPTQATIDNANGSVRIKTEHFLDKLRQENGETNGTREEPPAVKESNHNQDQPPTAAEQNQQQAQPQPTTPISPNSFQTPKRPTVPAPPPPTNWKPAE
ncbi:hypothetical protein M5D96_002892 [Drosophila gunungcola]|uniref:Uncharacterized protein n=3 Tax=Drosophila gunungcola TaxID=103775 RepID=A0A9P9Z1T5_9MUSC|nr:hypothetical protein M5D96_002892 [Drosophila gunungcola]